MKTKDLGIGKIKYGEVHRFYPFKFDSKKVNEAQDIYNLIKQSGVIFKEEYQKSIMDSLEESLTNMVQELQDVFAKDNILFKMQDIDNYKKANPIPCVLEEKEIRLEFEDTGSSIKMKFYPMELEELKQQIYRLNREEEISFKIYGNKYVMFQNRFVLLPFKVKLNNGKTIWLNSVLYIFANGMGLLKLVLPLIDVDIVAFKKNELDSYLAEVMNVWKVKNYSSKYTFDAIAHSYLKSLAEDIKIDIHRYGNEINYISLIDFEGMPDKIQSIKTAVLEDLYRIITAPVGEGVNCVKEAQDYIKNNSWGRHEVNYVVKTTGGCLSYIGRDRLKNAVEKFKEKTDLSDLNAGEYFYFCNFIATEMFINVEFALIITMLSKLNDCGRYYEMLEKKISLVKARQEYNRNSVFLYEMQEECYGSVSEQTDFFQKRMYNYLKQELMDKKIAAMDSILKEEEERKEENFQKFLAVGGFLLALLFGLPAIYETLVIIRSVFNYISYDIPIVTIENFSVFLWLILNVVILFNIVKSRH